MSWQNIVTLVVVLGVATFFVWRGSGVKDHKHGCGCGCAPGDEPAAKKDKTAG